MGNGSSGRQGGTVVKIVGLWAVGWATGQWTIAGIYDMLVGRELRPGLGVAGRRCDPDVYENCPSRRWQCMRRLERDQVGG